MPSERNRYSRKFAILDEFIIGFFLDYVKFQNKFLDHQVFSYFHWSSYPFHGIIAAICSL